MNDERLDRDLTERLRAYESRLPDAAPPVPGASRSSATPRWPILGVGALAAVAAVLLLAVLIRGSAEQDVGDASASPVPSQSAPASHEASATPTPTGSTGPTPTPQPTASPPDPTVELRWSETASFGSPDAPAAISDVVRSDAGLVAVGVAYDGQLPIVGPTPRHEGRVWLSTDAVTWSDVTPESVFVGAELNHLLVTSDRRLIAHGFVEIGDLGERRVAAWESVGGHSWEEVDTGFPDEAWPMSMAHGPQGHVAVVVELESPMLAVWWSADGRTWQRVHDLGAEGGYSAGAGDEGFVIAGYQGQSQAPFAIASGDGREWFESSTPPGVAVAVAPLGGDWLAVSRDPGLVVGEASEATFWESQDGLEWSTVGSYPLAGEGPSGAECTEFPISLLAAGPWLVSGTMMSFGCSEGGVQTMGTQRISVGGAGWAALPFAPPAAEVGLGTRISGAVEVDNRLILVGEQDRMATFWIGERP